MAFSSCNKAICLSINLLFVFLATLASGQDTSTEFVRKADSLFTIGDQIQAVKLYQKALANGYAMTDAMLLKLASAYERQNDVPHQLYYLGIYFERHPDDAVLRRLNDIAKANNLSGYETDDLNYFYLFYRKYGIYILLFLLIPAGLVFGVLILKLIRKQSISGRQKGVLFIYLLLLLVFTNLPEGLQSGITNHDRVLLRTDPSAAAPIFEVIGKGHKVNILGKKDIYLRVLWDNKLYFIRQDNVWLM